MTGGDRGLSKITATDSWSHRRLNMTRIRNRNRGARDLAQGSRAIATHGENEIVAGETAEDKLLFACTEGRPSVAEGSTRSQAASGHLWGDDMAESRRDGSGEGCPTRMSVSVRWVRDNEQWPGDGRT